MSFGIYINYSKISVYVILQTGYGFSSKTFIWWVCEKGGGATMKLNDLANDINSAIYWKKLHWKSYCSWKHHHHQPNGGPLSCILQIVQKWCVSLNVILEDRIHFSACTRLAQCNIFVVNENLSQYKLTKVFNSGCHYSH